MVENGQKMWKNFGFLPKSAKEIPPGKGWKATNLL